MRIATFNINGIKARGDVLARWLDESKPDVAVLQEIKSIDANVPRALIEDRGYHLETHGQKGFNGVAILSRTPLTDVRRGLPGDDGDEQARWIEATVGDAGGLRVCGLYLPNGNPAPGPKFDYKLAWMARMQAHAKTLLTQEVPLVLAGDYNVIPQPDDAARPEAWAKDALFLPESRAAFRRLLALGFYDAVRLRHPESGIYSFWDYQAGAWSRNDGIRIDHLLLSPQAADRLRDAWVETGPRGWDKPSDHTPVWADLDL
ncbi:MAG: exodeoxyribonuclease III [Rhodobacteraceae bacterium HLUCCA12]|nr:MAG: exodeoxyribonuclease III [Rhodobacteraceae bacterium HLUCCA12]